VLIAKIEKVLVCRVRLRSNC